MHSKTVSTNQKVKIFNLGLSRTGTNWLHQVLTTGGLKSAHFLSVNKEDALNMIEKLDHAGDTPIPSMAHELKELYPNARFIITTRPKSEWLLSMKWMLTDGKVKWNHGRKIDCYHKTFYGTSSFNSKILERAYDKHHEYVKNLFKDEPNRLLEVNINKPDLKLIARFTGIDYERIKDLNNKPSNRREPVRFKSRTKYRLKRLLRLIP